MSKKNKKQSANDFVNVRDIKHIYLYTKNGYTMCYLKVYPYNIDLLSDEEREAKTNMLASSFDSDRKDFAYFSLPREIDLERYKQHIKSTYDGCLGDFGRKHILGELIQQATDLESNGENYEHQQFIKLWKLNGSDQRETERILRTRLTEFKDRYAMAGIKTEILNSDEILKMCNLFGNATQAPYDVPVNTMYDPLLLMK